MDGGLAFRMSERGQCETNQNELDSQQFHGTAGVEGLAFSPKYSPLERQYPKATVWRKIAGIRSAKPAFLSRPMSVVETLFHDSIEQFNRSRVDCLFPQHFPEIVDKTQLDDPGQPVSNRLNPMN